MSNFDNILERIKSNYILKKISNMKIHSKDTELEKNLDITKDIKFYKYDKIVAEYNKLFDEYLEPSYKNIFNEKIDTLKIKRENKFKGRALASYFPSLKYISMEKKME